MASANTILDLAALDGIVAHATKVRHELHENPEVAYQEVQTAQRVRRELATIGIPFNEGLAGGTGTLATINTGKPGRCVALRADIDALPIDEANDLPYRSKRQGFMHACGHDGHTAILLGAAALLMANRDKLTGTIKLLFQPAEEGGCGADKMCDDKVLENPKVDAVFGLHGWPGLPVGMVSTRVGPLLAGVDGFKITIQGRGGHAAAPHTAINPIVAAAAITQALHALPAVEVDAGEASIVTVSQVHAGSAFNVIPDTAEVGGTIRALSLQRRDELLAAMRRLVDATASAHRCTATLELFGTTPPTTNTEAEANHIRATAQRVLGEKSFVWAPKPAMWGEDFAFYLQRVPGCFFVLGVKPHHLDTYPMLHHPRFDFTDAALKPGILMMAEAAAGFLA